MIIAKPEILKLIKKNKIIIEPFDEENIGPASVDFSLDSMLRVPKKTTKPVVVDEKVDYKDYTKFLDISKGYTLRPGELVMGITKEKLTLPPNVCAWIHSRSRFARLGLMSHITAPFIAPGVSNRQVLEIYNAGHSSLKLYPGLKICHIIFQYTKGKYRYEGKFMEQDLR